MKRLLIGITFLASTCLSAHAEEAYSDSVKAYLSEHIAPLLASPEVVSAVEAQNAETAGLDQAKIDALDKEWRSEAEGGAGPKINEVLAKELSKKLAEVRNDSAGVVTEIFIMDAKGLNVAQSDVTSDYWQGDEDKFTKSYGAGPNAVFVDEVEKDESTQQLQTQASVAIADPASGKVIGAVTVGINLDKL